MHYVNTFEEQTFGYLHVNILIIPGLSKKPGLRPKPGRAKPEPPSTARLKVLESPSPQKPGQSRGFQAKPGRAHHYVRPEDMSSFQPKRPDCRYVNPITKTYTPQERNMTHYYGTKMKVRCKPPRKCHHDGASSSSRAFRFSSASTNMSRRLRSSTGLVRTLQMGIRSRNRVAQIQDTYLFTPASRYSC